MRQLSITLDFLDTPRNNIADLTWGRLPGILSSYTPANDTLVVKEDLSGTIHEDIAWGHLTVDVTDSDAKWNEKRIYAWNQIQAFNSDGTPETNPEYVRGQIELFLDLYGREDEYEYKEDLIAAVFKPEITNPDEVMNPVARTFDEIAARQGWNDKSINQILRDYINSGRQGSLDEYAHEIAEMENEK